MRIPIRFQLMGPLVAVAAVSLATVAVVYGQLATRQTRQRIERQVSGVTQVLRESSFPLTDKVLQQMAGLAGAELLLTDDAGTPIAASSRRADAAATAVNESSHSTTADQSLGKTLTTPAGVYFHSTWPVDRPDRSGAARTLHVLVAKTEYDAAWRAAFLPPILVGAIASAAIAGVTLLATGRLSRLMARIGGEVRRLADGDFRPVETPRLNDESRDLALAVNRAAARLAEYEEEVRSTERLKTLATLGAGMAHEVRNAATGCRMAIDLHAEECDASTSGRDTLDVAKRQLGLIEGRLKQYLSVGKGASDGAIETVDLTQVARDALELTAAAARHAGASVGSQLPAGVCPVRGVPEDLTHAVVNLLLNAIEAAAKRQALVGTPAAVSIQLRSDARGATLEVRDSGSGPDASVAPRVFEPFASDKPEGVGLGLAVVRSAVELGGGAVTWDRVEDETRFLLQMPLATEDCQHV
ncbi:sensor histidine kinase [Botrimarina mediterranea]|uniref:sensor histidine kinase n=1 Tax=Botrimarina mediterranea TaxID=2528022 RepID=UPI001187BEC1|nr:Sporulation kinase E [Planctomycetes bacterium K2D]